MVTFDYDIFAPENRDRYTEDVFKNNCEVWAAMAPKRKPYTEQEFDAVLEEQYHIPHPRYVSSADAVMLREIDMAIEVNPLEYYRAWQTPVSMGGYDSWKHSPKYRSKRAYYVNKALACGIASTWEEAEEYFKRSK